jgi:hypothetical protein
MVNSAKPKQALGDRETIAAIQRHHAAIRQLLDQFSEGEDIETASDSFFIVFTKPPAPRVSARTQKLPYASSLDQEYPML